MSGRRIVRVGVVIGSLALGMAVVTPVAAAPGPRPGPGTAAAGAGTQHFIDASPPPASPSTPGPGVSAASSAARFALANAAGLGIRGDLTPGVTSEGQLGESIVRFGQSFQGVPVLGGEVVVSVAATGRVLGAISETLPGAAPGTSPAIPATQAAAVAGASVAKAGEYGPPELVVAQPSLWIYDARIMGGTQLPGAHLVWRTEVTSTKDAHLRQLVLVDAQRGTVALSFNQTPDARDRIVCDANNDVRNSDPTNPTHKYPCTPAAADRSEGGPAVAQADVNNAYDYSGNTYDFYWSHFGRDSLDNAGMALKSTVQFCDDPADCPLLNAFWDGNQMAYGQGFASADDVVAHELTHGVTDHSSSLFYYYQSGAINESLSDIFGEFVDLANGAGTDTPAVRWQVGEDLPTIGAIRDMANPPAFGDPDRTGSPLYWARSEDGGGVHFNSGVGNKMTYLLTDGGTFNGRSVTGVGVDKAAAIIYGASQRLTSAADYMQFGAALRQSCTALVGSIGINPSDCEQVDKAILATEMDVTPVNAALVVPETCPAGQSEAATVWSDDMEDPGSGNWARSAAAAGQSTWRYASEPNPYDWSFEYATSGRNNLWGDAQGVISDHRMTMTTGVTVPPQAHLRFNHAFGFEASGGSYWDGGVLEYSTDAGSSWLDAGPLLTGNGYGANRVLSTSSQNPLGGRSAFAGDSRGYLTSVADLSSLAGQSVLLRFRIGTDRYLDGYGWFVDDVKFYQCAGTAPQSISFEQPPTAVVGSGPLALSASASSGLPVTLAAVTPQVCSVSGSAANPLAPGTCSIIATQPGGGRYLPADSVTRSFAVLAAQAAPPNSIAPAAPTAGSGSVPAAVPTLVASIKAVDRASKLRVTVTSECSGQYRFRLQKQTSKRGDSWRTLAKRYATKGARHALTVNRPKGVYRAVIAGKCAMADTTTRWVKLRK